MTSDQIKNALRQRYSDKTKSYANPPWIVFEELRSNVGYTNGTTACDFVSLKVAGEGLKIVAHEIKISRQDFKIDVVRFTEKHRHALKYSTEFYYVCPWGLISVDEVPQNSGLMWINKSFQVSIKKVATFRNIENIPINFFKSFFVRMARSVTPLSISLKYLNKNITEEDLQSLIDEKVKQQVDYHASAYHQTEYERRNNLIIQEKERWIVLLEQTFPYSVIRAIKNNDAIALVYAKFVGNLMKKRFNDESCQELERIKNDLELIMDAMKTFFDLENSK